MRTLRKPLSWLASPFAYASARVAIAGRCRVLSGPFAGLRYPPSFVPLQLFAGPYQVGSFELELHPAVERIAAAGPATVVNVGSAEGYYAVGMALRAPAARVIGFELDADLRAAAARLAAANGVADRLDLRGLCTVGELAALEPAPGGPTAVIMDCEGAESELADPERVPWLLAATLVIELHPAIDADVRARLAGAARAEPRARGREHRDSPREPVRRPAAPDPRPAPDRSRADRGGVSRRAAGLARRHPAGLIAALACAAANDDEEVQVAVEQALAQFKETEGGEAFRLQNSKLLKVELAGEEIQTKLGSMVAYQGDVHFEHAGSGGLSRMLKKAVTNEGTQLMKVTGTGEVFLADTAQEIQLLQLAGEKITVNGPHVLAFESGIDWDIKRVEGASGALSGGLYNMELSGTGTVALVTDGPPVMIELDGTETFADPQAAITWSEGVTSSVKTDVNLKTFIGKGSGETIQLAFSGQGWLLIQPSEGRVAAAGKGGGAAGALGNLLGG